MREIKANTTMSVGRIREPMADQVMKELHDMLAAPKTSGV